MENGTLRDRRLRQSSLWDLAAWCQAGRLSLRQLPRRISGFGWRGLFCALGIHLALLGGVAPAQAFTGTDTGTVPNFCIPDEDSFDWGDCYRFNFEVVGSSFPALVTAAAQVGVDTETLRTDLAAEKAARIAADAGKVDLNTPSQINLSTVTAALALKVDRNSPNQVNLSTVTAALALKADKGNTSHIDLSTVTVALALKADKGNTAHIDLSTVTTALAGKAPLTGGGTSGTWPITAANVTTNANLTGTVTSVGNATSIAAGAISNAMLANAAVANLSGTNTGDQTSVSGNAGTATALAADPADCSLPNMALGVNASGTAVCAQPSNITGNAATVTTNANLTGPITSVGNATTIVGPVPPATVDLSTVTTALATKQATGNYITGLTGAVTASGPGSVAATIVGPVPASAVDLSTVTTALAGKAPLTGAGTSGTWGISVTGTAAALAADPADAASGYVSRGINASGTVQPAWVETAATSGSTNPVTSGAMFTALSGKQASGNYITALTGDVTAAGPGSAAATIANLPAISGANLTNLTAANIANGTMGTVNTGGNAATATALAANPADCAANQFANAISASGSLSCAAIADADVPNTITVDLAATATALVATPGNCVSGEFYTGLTANGTRTCAAPSGGGDMVLASTQTVSGAKIFTSSVTVGALVYTATATTSGFDQAGRGSVIVNSWMIVASTNPSAATAAIFYGLQNRRWYRVRYNLTHNTTSGAMNVTFNEVGGTAYSWVNQCFHSNLLSETSGSSGGGSWRQDGVTNSFAGRVRSGWFEFYNDGNNLKGNSNFSTTINADPVTNACNGALTLSSAITLESVKMESSAGTLTGSIYLEQLIAPNP